MLFINSEQNTEETDRFSNINLRKTCMFSLCIFHSTTDRCKYAHQESKQYMFQNAVCNSYIFFFAMLLF
jgi:hypothetical protein